LYDSLLNTFELCTKRSPRRIGVHAWEKYLTVEEFRELSAARDAFDKSEADLEQAFTPELIQVNDRSRRLAKAYIEPSLSKPLLYP
jgi:hypothetical protein